MDYADAYPTLTDHENNDSGPFEDSEDEDGDKVQEVQGGTDALDSRTAAEARDYSMNAPKRGKVLIFNHVYFDGGESYTRLGSDRDVARLRKYLPLLGFKNEDIKVYNDLTYLNIVNTMEELKKDEELKQSDCVMVFILTHGLENDIIMAKDRYYSLHSLIEYFTPKSLPSMAGKPKIFIVQACRGRSYDHGVLMRLQPGQPGIDQEYIDSHKCYIIPEYADLILLMSSHHGHLAFRHNKHGTWLIRDFCKAIQKLDLHTTSFQDILMETMLLVSLRQTTGDPMNKKQAASVYTTSFRKVYFRPSK